MPLQYSYNIDSPDSLDILLKKAHAIQTINQENLIYIVSRKCQKVVTRHKCNLQTNSTLKSNFLCTDNDDDDDKTNTPKHEYEHEHENNGVELMDKSSIQTIHEIIEDWRYHGEALTEEKIAIDAFIDLKLDSFDDLIRLNDAYDNLLDLYSRLLMDDVESRITVDIVLRNLELLQVAIGEIHEQLLDFVDASDMKDAMESFMNDISNSLTSLQSKVPGLCIDLQAQISRQTQMQMQMQEGEIVDFLDGYGYGYGCESESLSCKHTLSIHKGNVNGNANANVWALEPYMINGTQYLASAGADETIKLWDLSTNELAAKLTSTSISSVWTLTSYVKNGVQMLASAGADTRIELWDLSTHTKTQTLSTQYEYVHVNVTTISAYENDEGTNILVTGMGDGQIKLWNLDSYSITATMQGHGSAVDALSVYHRHRHRHDKHKHKPYLASGGRDGTIKIWNLEDSKMILSLGEGVFKSNSLVIVSDNANAENENEKMLVSADAKGCIKIWNLNNYDCVQSFKAHSFLIQAFQVIRYDGKLCVICPGDDKTLQIWDLQHGTMIHSLKGQSQSQSSNLTRLRVFMNCNQACLASGHKNGEIKLWM